MFKTLIGILISLACLMNPAVSADLSIALGAPVTSMDPHFANLAPNNCIAEQIFDTLIRRDARQRSMPGLAESWSAIDESTWEFRLRKGVKFHDGSDFTAEDVKFSIERPDMLRKLPKGRSDFTTFTSAIVETTVVDPYTIRVKTAGPYPNVPTDLMGIAIVSSKAARNATNVDFDSGKATIGTGPLVFKSFSQGDRIVLSKNDYYWGTKSQWDTVTFRLMTSDPARVAALLAGDVHIIEYVPTVDYIKLKSNKNINVFNTVSHRMVHLQLDSNRDVSPFVTDRKGLPLASNPLKDARVRKAISKAINRQAIVDRVMTGLAAPASQLMHDNFFGASPRLKPEPYDPEGAKRLLAEAGYPNGFGLTLHGPNDRLVNDKIILQAVAQMLARVGIDAKAEAMVSQVLNSRARNLELSVLLQSWGTTSAEGSQPLRYIVASYDNKSRGLQNFGRYSNGKVDELLNRALSTLDNPAREKLLQQAAELTISDYGVIPLHFQVNTWAARKPLIYEPRMDERTYAHAVRSGT